MYILLRGNVPLGLLGNKRVKIQGNRVPRDRRLSGDNADGEGRRAGRACSFLWPLTRRRNNNRRRGGAASTLHTLSGDETREEKSKRLPPAQEGERALADRPEATTQSNAYLQIHHDNIRRGLHLRRRRART